jgi:hypothetical protein
MTQKPAAPALVSATLAQVYIQQDHLEQARRMLARVLQANPEHGHALALVARLQARSRARLYAGYRPGRGLAVRWHDAPEPDAPELGGLHLVVAVFRPVASPDPPSPPASTLYVTSVAVRSAAGEHAFVFPGEARGPATATLCLARWDAGRLRPVAVHEPLSW